MRWFEHVKKGMTYREAYEATDKEHFEKFGIVRYKNFESFQFSYYSAMKNRKTNKI